MLIESQLYKTDAKLSTPESLTSWIPPMLERAELASLTTSRDIRSPKMLDSRIVAVQTMADLCGRAEAAKRSSTKRGTISQEAVSRGRTADIAELADATANTDAFPMRCHELQCLFCIGDEKLNLKDRTRIFCRLWATIATQEEKT